MLTKLTIQGFKRFECVEIELGNPVVFIGPNNSGKTTALQALALWSIGLKRWNEKRAGKETPAKLPGVTINRRDLIALPVPSADLLWHDLHVRDVTQENGRPTTQNVRIAITLEGVHGCNAWKCGLEFDYANTESFYCRPLRLAVGKSPDRMPIPDEAADVNVAFLPPMSGLAANETRLDLGAIHVRIGEGRTAEVLRNLCYRLHEEPSGLASWNELTQKIKALFGVTLDPPRYVAERGEIAMSYREGDGPQLDLSSSGRGLQQVLLLLAYIHANPASVLLLDEPDAHLEILRQRQVYQLLTETAATQNCQVIAASHSEVLLNEAANRDVVIAFVGTPHRIDDRGAQAVKALKEIGFEHYYQAEQTGWVLYLEGSTDLAILRSFAKRLNHPAHDHLERPFVHYVANQARRAQEHFHGLREAKPDLIGFAVFDRPDRELPSDPHLLMRHWEYREIENYLCQPATLLAYAESRARESSAGPLFDEGTVSQWQAAMQAAIENFVPPAAYRDPSDRWWRDTKVSEEFLDRVFADFYRSLGIPNLMRKTDYHVLAKFVPQDMIDEDVTRVLDAIRDTAERATPRRH
jgi:energy-coupling factor transporter ATP-binding protein EcfA2